MFAIRRSPDVEPSSRGASEIDPQALRWAQDLIDRIGSSDLIKIFAGLAKRGIESPLNESGGTLTANKLAPRVFGLVGDFGSVEIKVTKTSQDEFFVDIFNSIGPMMGGGTGYTMIRKGDEISVVGKGKRTAVS